MVGKDDIVLLFSSHFILVLVFRLLRKRRKVFSLQPRHSGHDPSSNRQILPPGLFPLPHLQRLPRRPTFHTRHPQSHLLHQRLLQKICAEVCRVPSGGYSCRRFKWNDPARFYGERLRRRGATHLGTGCCVTSVILRKWNWIRLLRFWWKMIVGISMRSRWINRSRRRIVVIRVK